MRKIRMIILSTLCLFSVNSFAQTNHYLTVGASIDFELPPNDPQIFSNIFFWQISASCTVISNIPLNPISVKILRKTGSVNNIDLSAGSAPLQISFKNGESFNITAASGAAVELLNKSAESIKASCQPS